MIKVVLTPFILIFKSKIQFLSLEKLEIKPCELGSRIRDMEAEWRLKVITDFISYWIFGKQNWGCGMDRTNFELKCQSVRRDMMCMASNSLYNLRGQKLSCPCYHSRHLQKIHKNKMFCRMYGLGVMLDIARPKVHISIQIVVYRYMSWMYEWTICVFARVKLPNW